MWVLSCERVYAYVRLGVTGSVCASDVCQHGVHFWVCASFMCVFMCVPVLWVSVYVSQYLCWLLYLCVWYICVLPIRACVVYLHMLYVCLWHICVCVCVCGMCVSRQESVCFPIALQACPLHLTFSPQTLLPERPSPSLPGLSALAHAFCLQSKHRTSGIKSTGSGIRQI